MYVSACNNKNIEILKYLVLKTQKLSPTQPKHSIAGGATFTGLLVMSRHQGGKFDMHLKFSDKSR